MKSFQHNEFQLNQYLIKYPSNLKVDIFKEQWYYGIIFHIDGFRYELIHNYDMKTERLFINEDAPFGTSGCRDIPFKPETFHLLPAGVTVEMVQHG